MKQLSPSDIDSFHSLSCTINLGDTQYLPHTIALYIYPESSITKQRYQGYYDKNKQYFVFNDIPRVSNYTIEVYQRTELFIRYEAQINELEVFETPSIKIKLEETTQLHAYTPNDFLWPTQWSHHLTGIPQAWDILDHLDPNIKLGDGRIVVNINDTGVQSNSTAPYDAIHPDLAGNIIMPDGTSSKKIVAFLNLDTNGNSNMLPHNGTITSGHGTKCAGITLANGDNHSNS